MKIQAQIKKMNAVLDSLDRDRYGDDDSPDPLDLFRKIFVIHEYDIDGDRKVATRDCESIKLAGAPAFYRLLFLAQPRQLDCRDMYKSESLFALVSPDGEFVADIQFWKYEPSVQFSADPKHLEGSPRVVQCGIPGSNNGVRAKSAELKAWMALLRRCLERKWLMYSGNDFEV